MDIAALKKKIIDGNINDDELRQLLEERVPTGVRVRNKKGGFMENLLRGIKEGYTEPMLFKAVLEFLLLVVVIVSLVILTYHHILKPEMGGLLLALMIGFILGKIR